MNINMTTRRYEIVLFLIVLLSIVLSFAYYNDMPEKMTSHWNASGQVDGYMSRLWAMALMPIILAITNALFILIPKIDPLKANIEKFKGAYYGFIIVFSVFLLAMHYWMILWNLKIEIGMNFFLPVFLAVMFFFMGILCEKSKRNWFIGIRTPWTLSSDVVWQKTHKLGAKLFKYTAVIILAGMFFSYYMIYFILVPAIGTAAITTVYSYIVYRREKRLAA